MDSVLGATSDVQNMITHFRHDLDKNVEKLKCFYSFSVQVEGWLKGEFLYFLDKEKRANRLPYFDREVRFDTSRRKVDILVETPSRQKAWIELKHWFIGIQSGNKYNVNSYFSDGKWLGVESDVDKLKGIQEDNKFILILLTENPGDKDWEAGIEKFNIKFAHHVVSLTKPSDFPKSYFLGLLEVHK